MSKYREKSSIDTVIIHCADTPNGMHFTAADIDTWHKQFGFRRGTEFISEKTPLQYIGYHYVIGVDGNIENGRRLDETGAHARGHNQKSVGICLVGRDKFTRKQWGALTKLLLRLMIDVGQMKIIGHNDVSAYKTCPNFDVKLWLSRDFEAIEKHVIK